MTNADPFKGQIRSNMIIPPDDIISQFPEVATEWRCCKNGAWISLYKGQLSKPVDRTSPMVQKLIQMAQSDRNEETGRPKTGANWSRLKLICMSLKKNDFSQFLIDSNSPNLTLAKTQRARITPNQSLRQGLAKMIIKNSPQKWYASTIWSIRIPYA